MSLAYPKIVIIILNWNGKDLSLGCLESLSAIDYPHFSVILVDNGSTDDSLLAIQERFPHVHLIALPDNQGFAAGNNAGILVALEQGADFVLLLNNDTVVSSDLLRNLYEGFSKHPDSGILGARIYLFDQKDTLDHLGGIWEKNKAKMRLIGFREKDPIPFPATLIPLDYVCGACMMIKRSVIETIGLLEPRYFLYWEENDFCLRAKRAGFQVYSCPQAKIWHKVSASIIGGRTHSAYFIWRGRLLWVERQYPVTKRILVYLTSLLPAILNLIKLKLLKTIQLWFIKAWNPKTDLLQRKQKILTYTASLAGIKDYILRRFDQGPPWIYKK